MGSHSPCVGTDHLCPACALFGTAAGTGTRGRLRFTDAKAVRQPEMQEHTLQILGEPRTSSFEFYLRKPVDPDGGTVSYWNFDYYGVRKTEQTRQGKTVEHTEYHDLPESTPRGRKMYWHSDTIQPDERIKGNLNATMEAASNGIFRSRIYFERITQEQLEDLLWIITLGDNDTDSTMQFKLGHAKPLGYGSVKLTVDRCVSRIITDDMQMRLEPVDVPARPLCHFDLDSDRMRSILKMCDRNTTAGQKIEYLYDVNKKGDEQIFLWFQKNRIVNSKRPSPDTLPEPTSSDLTLQTTRNERYSAATSAPHAQNTTQKPYDGPRPQEQRQYYTPTEDDFAEARRLYPVGREAVAVVKNVTKNGDRVFFRLEGTKCDASSRVFTGQHFERGEEYRVRVVGYFEPKKNVTVKVLP